MRRQWYLQGRATYIRTKGISYEKDGVLTCSLGNCMNDDFFEEYTITSHKNLNIKLKFLKTALAELYYKIIDEKEFKELLNIV